MRKCSEKDTIRLEKERRISEYFREMSKELRPWLYELARKYKDRGVFPIIPMSILPSYYEDKRDKEIAAFVCILMDEMFGGFERVQAMRELIGEHPWKWFESRGFLPLATNGDRFKGVAGVRRDKLGIFLGNLWNECHEQNAHSVLEAVDGMAHREHLSYIDVILRLIDGWLGYYIDSTRLFLVVLATSDGIGQGVWKIDPSEIKSTQEHDLRQFLKTCFPDYRRLGFDKAIEAFGFDRGSDFLYAYWGWKELQKRNQKECVELVRLYRKWYDLERVSPPNWEKILFPIVFE